MKLVLRQNNTKGLQTLAVVLRKVNWLVQSKEVQVRTSIAGIIDILSLTMPRKPTSENVVCLCRLLNILANFQTYFCKQANCVDSDQTVARGAF